MSPAKREFVGYFLRVKDVFEGGVAKPELDENSTFLYWELKAMFPRINPEGIEVEKEDYEMQRFCDIALMRKPYCDQVQRNLRERKLWSLSEFKSFISEKGMKTGEESKRKKEGGRSEKDLDGNGVKEFEKGLGVHSAKGAEEKETKRRLKKIRNKLDEEIEHLKVEKQDMKDILEAKLEESLEDFEEEAKIEKEVGQLRKIVQDNKKKLEHREKNKWKESILQNQVMVEKKLEILNQQFADLKINLEAKLADFRAKKTMAKTRMETLKILEGWRLNFTILTPKISIFENQPKEFKSDLNRMTIKVKIEKGDENWEDLLNKITEMDVCVRKNEVLVIIMPMGPTMSCSMDEEVMEVEIEEYVDMAKMLIEKAKCKFERVVAVLPPIMIDSFKWMEELTNKLKEMPNEVEIFNLFEEQAKVGKRKGSEAVWKEGDATLAKIFYDEEEKYMSLFAARYIASMMANMAQEETGEVHFICDICALIHGQEKCPAEMEEKEELEKEEVNKSAHGKETKDLKSKDEKNRSQADEKNEGVEEDKAKEKDNGDGKNKREMNDTKSGERRNDDGERESRERRDSRERRRREDQRSRKRNRSPYKPPTSEKCMKCLDDHLALSCRIGPFFKCNICDQKNHHRAIHYAKKPKTVECLKMIHGPDFKFVE